MSIPEYKLCAEDHRTLLVVVKQIGDQISKKSFHKIFEKIKQVQYIKIRESGVQRCIWLRYENNYSSKNNEWGDFQTYRKVVGLISIGKGNPESNVDDLSKEHSALLDEYSNSVFDSRCFIFRTDSVSPSELNGPPEDDVPSPECTPVLDNSKHVVFRDNVEPVPKSHLGDDDSLFNRNSPNHDGHENSNELFSSLNDSPDFCSLPNVGDGITENFQLNDSEIDLNRLSSDSPVSPSHNIDLDTSPSGSEKLIIPSTSNSNSIHCIIYPGTDSCDQLKQDVKEFINSIYWILESKRLNRSFEKQEKIPLLTTPFEKKNFVGIDTDTRLYKKRCLGRMKKHIGDLALQSGLPSEAFAHYISSVEYLKSGQDWLWLASAYEGQCAASMIMMFPPSNKDFKRISSLPFGIGDSRSKKIAALSKSLPLGVDSKDIKTFGKQMLNYSELSQKYQEAIQHYQKYQAAAIVELECSMKAAKVLAVHEKNLEASKFLQNVVFTSLNQTEEEKVIRFKAISETYEDMGFHRKAAFFKRIAAMRCVSFTNPNPSWIQCYNLLLHSFEGYCLPIDAKDFPRDIFYGWPGIQIQMLLDIVGVAKQMDNQAVAVRHFTFLLDTLLNHLAPSEQQEICHQLEILTAKCEGAPVPLILDNGLVLPPVNLLSLPSVKSFKLQNLAPHLRPVKMPGLDSKLSTVQESIFIFTPFHRDRDKNAKDKCKIDFKWVEGDVCEVALQVFNPLPFELKVTHMGLLADDIPFESFPACLSLPAESGPYPVNLLGTPLNSGELQILGYTTHVLGVKNNCRLKDISSIKQPYFSVDVIPKLPQVQVSTSLPKASMFSSLGDTSFVVISATTTLYSGVSQECTVTVSNTGKVPIEWLEISMHSKLKKETEHSFFTWSKENIDSQLPIPVGSAASFTLYINAIGDFICPINSKEEQSHCTKISGFPSLRNFPEHVLTKVIEAVLQIQYSGGPGMEAGYCRRCAIALTVEVLSSILITKWDVIPSEIPTHCYLVLDIQNSTAYEMEVIYTSNKRILIEAHDVCRVPVPVERCPLSVMSASFGDIWSSMDICGHLWKNMEDPHDQKKAKLFAACRDHLVNLVDLQWTLPSLEISGQASISEISWTDDMLALIFKSPIEWDIKVNGRLYKAEQDFCFLAGDFITISIKLNNVTDVSLYDLYLFVRDYQDHQNGHQSHRLDNKRAIIGNEKMYIEEIKPHEEFSHECGFIFFHSGIYKLDILCSHNNPTLILDVMKIAPSNEFHSGNSNSHTYAWEHTCLIQKGSPSIDISVIED
ncbi:trafficking protein particle complex subunit 9 [Parasteatoda tepidariorum]|uniref:trafficking protein particle complex subunit 9 n=1 Tax=Parasteatoda tepidariorum TaxID=114398 RepID=UPI00077FDC12|nr:trafficking protein particle complex subunit 9 isoform X2 [Parasteatoda tepidariorum]